MDDGRPVNPLDVMQGLKAADLARHGEVEYENRRVQYLLSEIGAGRAVNRLRRELRDRDGTSRWLSFRAVDEILGRLPLQLSSSRLRDGRPALADRSECSLAGCLKAPWKLPFVTEWRRRRVQAPDGDGRPTGLVFPFAGEPHGLVVHDGPPERFDVSGGALVVRLAQTEAPLLVQTLTAVVGVFRDDYGWTPRT